VDDNVNIEVLVSEETSQKEKRGGKRPGAGRPSLVRENKARMEQGLEPILPKQKINKKAYKSTAILPEKKKARAQEVLAEMLGRKSKYIVQKVLDKALDDADDDQMACLKLVMDRILPADYLSKVKGKSNQIQINISGVGQETTIVGETLEAEYEEDDE
jgi:predicted DNA-binding protein